jgi:hypothetical protein
LAGIKIILDSAHSEANDSAAQNIKAENAWCVFEVGAAAGKKLTTMKPQIIFHMVLFNVRHLRESQHEQPEVSRWIMFDGPKPSTDRSLYLSRE